MTTPTAQLETAAQWLREGAMALGGREPSFDMYRVADDCERMAGKEPQGDAWVSKRVRGQK